MLLHSSCEPIARVLSPSYIGRNKAVACAEELKRSYTEPTIRALEKDATEIFDDLTHFDLIIDATGEEALSTSLNQRALAAWEKDASFPDIIFSFLIGNGDAAQAIFVNKDRKYACYKCLRPILDQDRKKNPLNPKIETQYVSASCGDSPFIPYGVACSAIAASLGLQAALSWVNGDPSPRLRTVRINKENTIYVKDKNWEGSSHCPACKSKKP